MADQLIGRRTALKYFGMLATLPAAQEFLKKWLAKASATSNPPSGHGLHAVLAAGSDASSSYVPQFFKPHEFETIEKLTEMIIPTDSEPGAKLQKQWTDGLSWLNQESVQRRGRPFREISPAERETLLTEMSSPERDPSAQHPGFAFYRLIKSMTVEGFYTSRVGLIDVLGYKGLDALPEFPGCTHPEHQT